MREDSSFNQYVNAYKKLPLQKKKEMVNEETKKLIAFIEKINADMGIKGQTLFNREILDLNSNNISDDDFTEAMFVYIHTIRESLGAYFNKVSEVLYK